MCVLKLYTARVSIDDKSHNIRFRMMTSQAWTSLRFYRPPAPPPIHMCSSCRLSFSLSCHNRLQNNRNSGKYIISSTACTVEKKVYMVGLLESLRQPLSDAGSGFFKSMSSRSSSESMRSTSSSIMSLAESAHTAAVASLTALLSTATFEAASAIANDYRYTHLLFYILIAAENTTCKHIIRCNFFTGTRVLVH